jgi:hypothetical protein
MAPPRDIVDEFVWQPLKELPVDVVFAFGKAWLRVCEGLGLPEQHRWGAGGEDIGLRVPSRTVVVFGLSSGQRVVVSWQPGYAGPPARDDALRLRELLARRQGSHLAAGAPQRNDSAVGPVALEGDGETADAGETLRAVSVGPWTVEHFSQSNPAGPGQSDIPALLRRVAETLEALGEISVHDVIVHGHHEITEYGPWPSVTVYFQRESEHTRCTERRD